MRNAFKIGGGVVLGALVVLVASGFLHRPASDEKESKPLLQRPITSQQYEAIRLGLTREDVEGYLGETTDTQYRPTILSGSNLTVHILCLYYPKTDKVTSKYEFCLDENLQGEFGGELKSKSRY